MQDDPTPERLSALELLSGYTGDFVEAPRLNALDVTDAYMLSNAWMYRVVNSTFFDALAGTTFAVPQPLPEQVTQAMPARAQAARRLTRLVEQLVAAAEAEQDPEEASVHNWLQGRSLSDIVLGALDDALEVLGERPWGEGMRNGRDMSGVGGVLGVVETVADAQLPSLNLAVDHFACGPVVQSSLPFGQSGFVGRSEAGEPVYDEHARDQMELFSTYGYRPEFRRFDDTLRCEARGDDDEVLSTVRLALLIAGVAGIALVTLLCCCCSKSSSSNPMRYEDIPDYGTQRQIPDLEQRKNTARRTSF